MTEEPEADPPETPNPTDVPDPTRPPDPARPPEDQGRPFSPDLGHPGDYGADEDEQRRTVGRPREEAP